MANKRQTRGNSIGASLGEGQMTRAELARRAKVSPDTIRRWTDAGLLEPVIVMRGTLEVRVYSEDDVNRAKTIAQSDAFLSNRAAS